MKKPWIKPLLIFLLVLLLFPLTSLHQAGPEELPGREDGTWRSLNNYTVIFLESWRLNGAWDTRFELGMPMDENDPRIVKPYSSYPSGYLLPLYLIAQNGDGIATLSRARVLANLGHFVLACLAGWTALLLATALMPAIAAAIATLFLPPLLLFQHNIWWIDTAGLVAAALVLLLHVRQSTTNLQLAGSAFFAGLIDWFTPLLTLLLSFATKGRRRWLLLAALVLAASCFLFQQYLLSSLHVVAYKFRVRTGIQNEGFSFSWLIAAWLETVRRFLGWGGLLIPLTTITLASAFRGSRSRLKKIWPFFAAVIIHWLLFNQHYPGHHYNTIRWAYAITLLPALFPRRAGVAASLLLLIWTASVYPLFLDRRIDRTTDLAPEELEACRLIDRNRNPTHLFVSSEFYFGQRVMGDLWYRPICRSSVSEARNMDQVIGLMHHRFLRFGLRASHIHRMFYLSKERQAPAWTGKTKLTDTEGAWHLFEFQLPP